MLRPVFHAVVLLSLFASSVRLRVDAMRRDEVTVDMSNVVLLTTGNLKNQDFVKLVSLADNPVGVTGDQSMIESVLLRKVPYYETMEWKHTFATDVEHAVRTEVSGGALLEKFLKNCPKEPLGMKAGHVKRYVNSSHLHHVNQLADFYVDHQDKLTKAAGDLADYITHERDFKDWLRARLQEASTKLEEERPLKVLLFTENIAGFGNAYNIERVGHIVEGFQSSQIKTVVTTINMEPGSIATPAALAEKFPDWQVPVGGAGAQASAVVAEAQSFSPDLVIAAPATSYYPNVLAYIKRELQYRQKREVIWLGEYASGHIMSNGTEGLQSMGISPGDAGVVVPDMNEKLKASFHSSAAATLASVATHVAGSKLFLFAYLHSEDAVRDYLLFANEMAKRTGKQAIVVMPRMKCVDGHEKDFRNMQGMLSSLIGADSSFGGTLKVFYVGQPEDEVLQWSAKQGKCVAVKKKDLRGSQSVVSSVHGLLDILGAQELKESLGDSSILEISEAEAHGLHQAKRVGLHL